VSNLRNHMKYRLLGSSTMPDPHFLKVGDLVRFVALPDEWSRPDYSVHRESVAFMKVLIKRSWPSRKARIDEYGSPWVEVRISQHGKLDYHSWAILESTDWRLVKRRV
jgi:hypothetical protein